MYDKTYPAAEEVPEFYGLPKIHKGARLSLVISSGIGIMHPVAKYLDSISNPRLGKTQHAINNSEDFVKKIKN